MADISYIGGLDLGQSNDKTALCICETSGEVPHRKYEIRYLKTWPLGTDYPIIVREVCDLYRKAPISGTPLVCDRTGVGRAVVDSFRHAGFPSPLIAVNITSGLRATVVRGGFNVPKVDLCGAGQVIVGNRRVIIGDIPLRDDLLRELVNFQYKITRTGQEAYEAAKSGHDDLAIAFFLVAWYSERRLPVADSFRVIRRNVGHSSNFRIILADSYDILQELHQPYVLLNILDPGEAPEPMPEGEQEDSKPIQCLQQLYLNFADTSPSAFNNAWAEPLEPYGLPPEDCVFSREMGKKLWKLLIPGRIGAQMPELLLIIAPNGDPRALSIALGITDTAFPDMDPDPDRSPRKSVIFDSNNDEWQAQKKDEAPNPYIYSTVKSSRGLVIGQMAIRFQNPKSRNYGFGESIESTFPSFAKQRRQ